MSLDQSKLEQIQSKMAKMPPQQLGPMMDAMAKKNPQALAQLVTNMNPQLLAQSAKYMSPAIVADLRELIAKQFYDKAGRAGGNGTASGNENAKTANAPAEPAKTDKSFRRPQEYKGIIDDSGSAISREQKLGRELGFDSDEEAHDSGSEMDEADKETLKSAEKLAAGNGIAGMSAEEAQAVQTQLRELLKLKQRSDEARADAEERAKKFQAQLRSNQRLSKSQIQILKNSFDDQMSKQHLFIEELKEAYKKGEASLVSLGEEMSSGAGAVKPDDLLSSIDNIKSIMNAQIADAEDASNRFTAVAAGGGLKPLEELANENADLRRQYDELMANPPMSKEVEEQITALDAQVEELAEENKTLKEKLASGEAAQSLKDEVAELRKKLKDIEDKAEEEKKIASGSASVQHDLESQLATLNDGLKQREAEKKELEEAMKELEELRAKDAENHNKQLADVKATGGTVMEKAKAVSAKSRAFMKGYDLLEEAVLTQQEDVKAMMTEFGNKTISTVLKFVQQDQQGKETLLKKYKKELAERKRLFNLVQELRGNIRVFARSRPLNPDEKANGEVRAINVGEENEIFVNDSRGQQKTFEFDHTFGPKATQEGIFEETKALITSCIDGYNVCIFAYGQTGSGKTYTMEGPPDDPGVNIRALKELFNNTSSRKDEWRYEISVYMLEIYNEQIRDLLDDSGTKTNLQVRSTPATGNYAEDVTEVTVTSIDDVYRCMEQGSANRSVASTNMNEHSSRSHSLLTIAVRGLNKITKNKSFGKLTLVDLAGSERVSKSDARGQRLEEAKNINKSLSALGDVMYALQGGNSHVPYRNSKLTHLLADSLGGDSKTLMFVHVGPAESNVTESICSLKFATRVHDVCLGQAKKHVSRDGKEAGEGRKIAARR